MIIDKNREGAWRIADIIKGYWYTQVYYFYTKKDAIKLFRKYRREIKNGKLSNME
jgi:hypothetical protein